MGSAHAQNRIPTAVVEPKAIANQVQGLKSGLALSPPMRTLPSGEIYAKTNTPRNATPAQPKTPCKLTSRISFRALVFSAIQFGAMKLQEMVTMRKINVGQKTRPRRDF